MSRWHNLYLDGHAHLVTATVRNWRPLLKSEAAELLYREWSAARARLSVRVLAYVVMPEHFDAILSAETGTSVRSFLQQTLSLTARGPTSMKGGLGRSGHGYFRFTPTTCCRRR